MKELLNLTLSFRFKSLLIEPSSNVSIQAFRSLVVGFAVFLADAALLWLIYLTGLHYLFCAVVSFIAAVMLNYALSTSFVFSERASVKKFQEILIYFIVSLVGLGLTIGLMWFFTEVIRLYFMISKVISTLIAFIWNFTARKTILYRKDYGNG